MLRSRAPRQRSGYSSKELNDVLDTRSPCGKYTYKISKTLEGEEKEEKEEGEERTIEEAEAIPARYSEGSSTSCRKACRFFVVFQYEPTVVISFKCLR